VWGKTKAWITMCCLAVCNYYNKSYQVFECTRLCSESSSGTTAGRSCWKTSKPPKLEPRIQTCGLNATVNFISNSNSPCCFFPQHFTGSHKHTDLIFVYIFLIHPGIGKRFFHLHFLTCLRHCAIIRIHTARNILSRAVWVTCCYFCTYVTIIPAIWNRSHWFQHLNHQ